MPNWSKLYDKRPRKTLPDGTPNPDYTPRKHTPGNKGGKKREKSKFERGLFVGWDGEGITLDDGTHVYALLANSTGTYIANPNGLSTLECLEFICKTSEENPYAIHTGFVFSYDASMILFSDLPYDLCKRIIDDTDEEAQKYGVEWNGYRIQYRSRKYLRVQRIGNPRWKEYQRKNKETGEMETAYKMNIETTCQIWDVFGFYQSSFVKAIEGWLGEDYPDLAMIKDGKNHRGTFTQSELESFILPYCQMELTALVKLCEMLYDALVAAGVKISRWDGAGAIAAAMLKMHEIKEHIGHQPPEVETAAAHAYFGGRIEIFKYGRYSKKGGVFHADIRSAYPYAQTLCPSLASGRWVKLSYNPGDEIPSFSVCKVRWNLSKDEIEYHAKFSIYPFPYRARSGTVSYPYSGEGWYWQPEVTAALKNLSTYQQRYPQASIEVSEIWTFIPDGEFVYPFQWLRDYYYHRAKLKAEGRPEQIVFKLGPNSCYGKTAQHTGYNRETGRRPPYHNLCWAGFITSFTRARLYDVSMQRPDKVLFIATDGIYATAPLDVPESKELGEYEIAHHDEIVICQSGVYFVRGGHDGKTDEERDRWANYSRGFDKGTLDVVRVLDGWRNRNTFEYFPSTRFIALGTACSSLKAWERRGKWLNVGEITGESNGRKLAMYTEGTKRMEKHTRDMLPLWAKKRGKNLVPTPAETLIDTFALFNQTPHEMSMRYRLPWEDDFFDLEVIDGLPRSIVEDEHDATFLS